MNYVTRDFVQRLFYLRDILSCYHHRSAAVKEVRTIYYIIDKSQLIMLHELLSGGYFVSGIFCQGTTTEVLL